MSLFQAGQPRGHGRKQAGNGCITKGWWKHSEGLSDVTSKNGAGSTVTIPIPVIMPPIYHYFPDLRILTVDDGEDILEYMEQA